MTCDSRFTGFDISLNHGAAVTLDFTRPSMQVAIDIFTTKKSIAKKHGGAFFQKPTGKDDDILAITRLDFISTWIERILHLRAPAYAGIEGYAYAMPHQAHQLGEVGGLARMHFYRLRIPYRIHDPASIKKYLTGKGNATKQEMIAFALRKWSFLFLDRHQDDETTCGDIVDACAIATLVNIEHKLRTGTLTHPDLPEDTLHVFNRVTKANPINLLARSWTIAQEVESCP